MNNLLKIIFGSCLGVLLAFGAFLLIGIGIVGALAGKADEIKEVKANSVLKFTFEDLVPEQTGNTEVDFAEFNSEKVLGLHDIVKGIEAAREDDRIKGIHLDITNVPVGSASASVLRDAIADFKDSGKFVTAYSKYYTQGGYYLASAADKVFVNPMGGVDFRGYGATISFFKEMLDEIGVKTEVFKVGKFKGAVEPFVRNELSEENRLQIRQYIDGLWRISKEDIAAARGLTPEKLEQIANDYAAFKAPGALSSGLVDVIGYEDEVFTEIRTRLGLEDDKKINFITINDYFPSADKGKKGPSGDRIAVVYAEGAIVDGDGGEAQIGDGQYVEVIRKLRKNDKVKAIVLRVNSGGGSAMASENIWRELKLCREAGKPVVTSMSDVAASGGYYIACASDSIFAEPNTITGSIGVFGLFPIAKELMNEKLHLNFDTVKTSQLSTAFNPVFELSEKEKTLLQSNTDNIYETFMTRVKDARNYPSLDAVNEVAQGRVWTGRKALEIGLVDRMGGLAEAKAAAAKLAGLEEYRTDEYPKRKDPFVKLIEDLTGEKTSLTQDFIKAETGDFYKYYQQIKQVEKMKGVQAIMPFSIEVQ